MSGRRRRRLEPLPRTSRDSITTGAQAHKYDGARLGNQDRAALLQAQLAQSSQARGGPENERPHTLQRRGDSSGSASPDAELRETIDKIVVLIRKHCDRYIWELEHAQHAGASPERAQWIDGFKRILSWLPEVDSEAKALFVEQQFQRQRRAMLDATSRHFLGWAETLALYEKRRELWTSNGGPGQMGADALERLAAPTMQRVQGVGDYITPEDYFALSTILTHKWDTQATRAQAIDIRLSIIVATRRRGLDLVVPQGLERWREEVSETLDGLREESRKALAEGNLVGVALLGALFLQVHERALQAEQPAPFYGIDRHRLDRVFTEPLD